MLKKQYFFSDSHDFLYSLNLSVQTLTKRLLFCKVDIQTSIRSLYPRPPSLQLTFFSLGLSTLSITFYQVLIFLRGRLVVLMFSSRLSPLIRLSTQSVHPPRRRSWSR